MLNLMKQGRRNYEDLSCKKNELTKAFTFTRKLSCDLSVYVSTNFGLFDFDLIILMKEIYLCLL